MYGGAVLSCSVGMRARVTVAPAPGLALETEGQERRIAGRDDLRLQGDCFDVARAALDELQLPALECRVRYGSEIPLRSGMAGSTALVVALLRALSLWMGKDWANPYQLAERARHVEHRLYHPSDVLPLVVCGDDHQLLHPRLSRR